MGRSVRDAPNLFEAGDEAEPYAIGGLAAYAVAGMASAHPARVGDGELSWRASPVSSIEALAEHAESPNSERVAALAKAFQEAMIKCTQRVWPGYSWHDKAVLFPDADRREAFRWQTRPSSRVEPIDFSTVSPAASQGPFWFDDAKTTMALSLDLNPLTPNETLDPNLGLGIHEAFHQWGQLGWQWPAQSSRSTIYPQPYEPRYLRYAMARLVQQYLETGDQNALAQARDVLERYQRRYADEARAIAFYDVVEGSARYVEFMGSAIGLRGCDASEKSLSDWYKARAYLSPDGELPVFVDASVETYLIGSLASLALRNTPAKQGWEAKVAAGQPPLAILLDGLKSVPAPEFPDKIAAAKALVAASNDQLKQVIEPFRARTSSDQYQPLALALTPARSEGSFTLKAFVHDVASGWELWLGFAASYADQGGPGSIKFRDITMITDASSSCGNALLFYLPKAAISLHDDTHLSLATAEASADHVIYHLAPGRDGKQWLCL